MNSQTTLGEAVSRSQEKRQLFMAACGTALALSVAAAIWAWQVTEHGNGTGAQSHPATPTMSSVSQSPATVSAPSGDAGTQQSPILYIAGSQSQADELRAVLDQRNRIRDMEGLGPLNAIIVIAESDTDAEFERRGIEATNEVRRQNGLPEIVVLNLRES
jgi:uncharacterized protein YkwD